MNISSKIADVIIKVAKKENIILSDLANEGIFHMPELAFVYECGKAIMTESQEVFGSHTPKWIREIDLGNGGPTDLVFEFENGNKIAIEFKVRDTSNAYTHDIVKLSKLKDKNILKIFCALIDVFDSKLPDDGRQLTIEKLSEHKVTEIKKEIFSTKQYCYTSPVSCVVALWSIDDYSHIKT